MKTLYCGILLVSMIACQAAKTKSSDTNDIAEENLIEIEINEIEEEEEPIADTCAFVINREPCNITTVDANGEEVDLESLRGSPFIVDLSAIWCGPCKLAAEDVQEIQDFYAEYNLKYVTILIENTDREQPTVEDLQEWAMNYRIIDAPIWSGNREMITQDPINLSSAFYLTSWPTFYYFDKDFTMRSYNFGYNPTTIDNNIQLIIDE